MVCKYCKKPLPEVEEMIFPHCFALWEPDIDNVKPVENEKDAEVK